MHAMKIEAVIVILFLIANSSKAQEEACECVDGNPGTDGEQGLPGRDGQQGPPGRDGRDGSRGRDGREGPPGRDGQDGYPGPRGPRGPKGEKGVLGDQGVDGPEGMKGEKGEQGVQGPVGPDGERGLNGSQGEPGLIGATGPRGDKGQKGENGIVGQQGLTGPIGLKGQKGARGYTGSTGLKGQKGTTGPTGPIGLKGQKGIRGYTGSTGFKGQKGTRGYTGPPGPRSGGVVYTRWGKRSCPRVSQLLYAGNAGLSHWEHMGGGVNYLCMPLDPVYDSYIPGVQGHATMYGVEYENPVVGNVWQHNAVCAVCMATTRQMLIMIPAKTTCPPFWTKEYSGYLMTEHKNNYRSRFECVERSPESVPGSYSHGPAGHFWHIEANCDTTLLCPPYNNYKELTCVVCTK